MPPSDDATESLAEVGFRDHARTSEYRIVGPPGTGKTARVASLVKRDVARLGTDAVLVTSFSRTAATELANCELPVNPDRIGTLHSHCYRSLSSPTLAEANVQPWNRHHSHLALTAVKDHRRLYGEAAVADEDIEAKPPGDVLLQNLNRYRGLMVDRTLWPARVREFELKWSQYKRAAHLVDFCDLIDICLKDVGTAPGNPSVIFADEAQDLNRMQICLLRKWGRRSNYYVLAFDDDQTIFTFTGASPEAILDAEIPATHMVPLVHSHRVPEAVHRVANGLARQLRKRQPKVYWPRPEPGSVRRLSCGGYKSPEYSILSSAMKHVDQGKTVMFLGSCSYMLRPITALLRNRCIPFHNPYRKANGRWNPLRLTSPGSAARRVLALLGPHPGWAQSGRIWSCAELLSWTEWLAPKEVLRPGARNLLSAELLRPLSSALLSQVFESRALESLNRAFNAGYSDLLKWWIHRVSPDFRARSSFPVEIALRHGPAGLVEEPAVVVGTIHSVKGGQADVVYLFPDLSTAACEQYRRGGDSRDAVIRLFYVGVTRAREALYICSPETASAVSI